jgi:hypothetical protein
MRFFEFADLNLNEAPIGVSGLFKYQNTKKDRVPIFLTKIEKNQPFKINTKSGPIDIVIDPSELEKARQWVQNPTTKLKLKTTDEKYPIIPFGSIIKTKDFGGEEAFQREKIEQGQIGEVQSQLEDAKSGKPSIKLKVGNNVVDAAAVEKEKASVFGRAPKSDMTVLDIEGNPVAWVSLKGDPFRWGGWQHLIKMPEISEWLERIRQVNNGIFEPGMSFGLNISDELANKIVFGKEFGGPSGFSNVDAILIGDVSIKNGALTAGRSYVNGKTPTGSDKPYLVMRYMQGRNDVGFKNVRAETNTTSEGRKVKWLNTDSDVASAVKMFSDEKSEKEKLATMTRKEKTVYKKQRNAGTLAQPQPPVQTDTTGV